MSPSLMGLLNITTSRASSKAADENPYMFDTSGFETIAIRMTQLGFAEKMTVAAKMLAVEKAMVMENCDSDKLTSTLKPTTV